MKKLLLLPLALLALTACEGETPEDAAGVESKTHTYRGADLTCYAYGSGVGGALTCDFDAFYRANPKLAADRSEAAEEGVMWWSVRGRPLACVVEGSGDSLASACDWARFYAKNPDLTGEPR